MGRQAVQIDFGRVFGRLTILERVENNSRGASQYKCVCECGNAYIGTGSHLLTGFVQSCGKCSRSRPNEASHLPDGTTIIFLERKDGRVVPCRIDTLDYPLVKNLRWSASKQSRTYYAVTKTENKSIKMHQLIGGKGWDHQDGNGLNNRRSNLRPATSSDNNRSHQKQERSTSLYKCVYQRGRKYKVYIYVSGKWQFLGSFESEVEAALAYDAAARKYFGDFACVNFPLHPNERAAIRGIDDTPEGEEP